jgi:hypothetical protein
MSTIIKDAPTVEPSLIMQIFFVDNFNGISNSMAEAEHASTKY